MPHTQRRPRTVLTSMTLGVLLLGGCVPGTSGMADEPTSSPTPSTSSSASDDDRPTTPFREALEATPSTGGDIFFFFFFGDTARIREEVGVDTGQALWTVGTPSWVTTPPIGPRDALREFAVAFRSDATWSISAFRGGAETTVVDGPLADDTATLLEALGWSAKGSGAYESRETGQSIRTRLEPSRSVTVGGTDAPELIKKVGTDGLDEDEALKPLLGCIGEDPLAVSYRGSTDGELGMRSWAIVTDLRAGTLRHRACVLADSGSARSLEPALTAPDTPLGGRAVKATNLRYAGDVASADLEFRYPDRDTGGVGPDAALHDGLPKRLAPGW